MNRTLGKADIRGTVVVPASKSQTIRGLLIALAARGRSVLHNPLISDDTKACMDLCRQLGCRITISGDSLVLDSSDLELSGSFVFDCRNSGSVLFFATALCAAMGIKASYRGDSSLGSRSAGPLLNSLVQLGAELEDFDGTGHIPYTVCGPFHGGDTVIECRTSQYLSALLLACPLIDGDTVINVPLLYEVPYVIMTENWLREQGIRFEVNSQRSQYKIYGNQSYHPFETVVKGDFSSASFFFCSAAITGGSVTVKGLDPFDPQGDKGILSILRKMGCRIHWEDDSVTVEGPATGLEGGTFDLNFMPDAFPALSVAFCFARNGARIVNVPQARLKETDRIAVMAENLKKLGACIKEHEDGIEFLHPVTEFSKADVSSFSDHRIAMAMAVASLRSPNLVLENSEVSDITFPNFFDVFKSLCVPVNSTRIICFGDTEPLAALLADKRCEILRGSDVIENPQILGNFTTLGILFEVSDTVVPEETAEFVCRVLASEDLSGLEYLFTVVQAEKPGKSLRMMEHLYSYAGCISSYCDFVAKGDKVKIGRIREALDTREIRIADRSFGALRAVKKYFKDLLR